MQTVRLNLESRRYRLRNFNSNLRSVLNSPSLATVKTRQSWALLKSSQYPLTVSLLALQSFPSSLKEKDAHNSFKTFTTSCKLK